MTYSSTCCIYLVSLPCVFGASSSDILLFYLFLLLYFTSVFLRIRKPVTTAYWLVFCVFLLYQQPASKYMYMEYSLLYLFNNSFDFNFLNVYIIFILYINICDMDIVQYKAKVYTTPFINAVKLPIAV
jgi:hypothetical protein